MVQKLNSLRWKFTAGTKAKANEVNENFTQLLNKDNELIDAIDTINAVKKFMKNNLHFLHPCLKCPAFTGDFG